MTTKSMNTTFTITAGLLVTIGIASASIFMIPTVHQQASAQIKPLQNMTTSKGTNPMTGTMSAGNMTPTARTQMMAGMMNMMSSMPMTTMSNSTGMNTMSSMLG